MQSFTPVIIGVGEVKNKTSACIEPLQLILQAIRDTAVDAVGHSDPEFLSQIDSVHAVRTWTWPYDDLAGDIADGLKAAPAHKFTMARHSGSSPAYMLDEAARRVAGGQSKLAVIAGGEALASRERWLSNIPS